MLLSLLNNSNQIHFSLSLFFPRNETEESLLLLLLEEAMVHVKSCQLFVFCFLKKLITTRLEYVQYGYLRQSFVKWDP